jgi:hypothetical protein
MMNLVVRRSRLVSLSRKSEEGPAPSPASPRLPPITAPEGRVSPAPPATHKHYFFKHCCCRIQRGFGARPWSSLHCSAVQCNAVQYSALQQSTDQSVLWQQYRPLDIGPAGLLDEGGALDHQGGGRLALRGHQVTTGPDHVKSLLHLNRWSPRSYVHLVHSRGIAIRRYQEPGQGMGNSSRAAVLLM